MKQTLTGETVSRPEIRLRNGDMEAVISPQGGVINGLWLNAPYGRDELLYPRGEVQTPDGPKTRGGSHVCLPVFGPSEGLDQHGFGRDLAWEVLTQGESDTSLVLSVKGDEPVKGSELYAGLFAQLHYALRDKGTDKNLSNGPSGPRLEMTLIVENQGEEPMVVSPGFHPYFAAPEGWRVEDIADDTHISTFEEMGSFPKVYSEAELTASCPVNSVGGQVWMELGNRAIEIKSDNLPSYVVWSGLEAPYICLEPIAAGGNDAGQLLVPNETRTFRSSVIWHSI